MVLLVLDEHTVRPIRQLGGCGAAVGHVWRVGAYVFVRLHRGRCTACDPM